MRIFFVLLLACHTAAPLVDVQLELLAARQALADGNARFDNGQSLDRATLEKARAWIGDVLQHQPGRSDAAETELGLALLLGDSATLLRAWKSYFFVTDKVNAVLTAPYATLNQFAWKGEALSSDKRRALARALAESRFYDSARRFAGGDPALRDIVAYAGFVDAIGAVDADFYPRVARGLKDYAKDYDSAIDAAAAKLWPQLEKGPFNEDKFFDRIKAQFGADGYLGETVGYHGLLLGHIIHDEPRQIEQYGRSAAFRLVVIDRLVSRDFTSWLGTTNVGGWGTPDTMFQVRPAYLAEPFTRLGWVTDKAQHEKMLAEIKAAEEKDLTRCRADPYADAASVALRLKLSASEQIYAGLKARGLSGEDLALAFVSESLRLNVEATVFAHEGRHSLDQKYFAAEFAKMSDDERELRAKFSEVVFSENPRLALTGSILGASLDASTGHGKANRRFRTLLVDWMRAHASEIHGLDATLPLVMQIGRLSDQQLVAIVKAADPMAPH